VYNVVAAGGGDTPSVLSVPIDEFIVGILAFFIVFGVLGKIALPRIKAALAARSDAIEGGIARAEQAQAEAQQALAEYQAALASAREEAAAIRTQAQADRAAIIEEARAEARSAASAVTAAAEAQMAAERSQATAQLTREIGEVAVALSSKIVGQSLTDDARVRATVDEFLSTLETMAAQRGSQA